MEPGELAAATGGKVEPRSVPSTDEVGRHEQNLLAQGLKRGILKLRREAWALEPIHEIVAGQRQRLVQTAQSTSTACGRMLMALRRDPITPFSG
jgi:hypothetical protein